MTALAEEKAAVVAAVGEANCAVIRGPRGDVHVVSVGALRVAVVSLLGMGNVGAAAAAREVIEAWQPRFLVLVGITAGIRGYIKELQLGDVLVADQVVGFELAKITTGGRQRRYQSFRPHFDLLAAAHDVQVDEWVPMMATPRPHGPDVPRVHVGTVLSGEKILADITSVQELGRAWPTAVGVEMEGLGVALAAYRSGSGFLVVKGVSDFADAGKDDRWRTYAAEAAARFALAVLRRYTTTPLPGPRPRQLPRDAIGFTGRSAELARLLAVVSDRQPQPVGTTVGAAVGAAVVIWAIDGMAGIGKTALAVHAAHRIAEQYPDGQLFLDLHGFTAGVVPVQPAEALDRLLRAVGVPGERIPADVDERAGLWRSLMADRRMLIVLDNAATEAQILPLLPGTAGCLVLVTSRRRLAALEATHTVALDTLPLADAVTLFVRTADRPDLPIDTPERHAELIEVAQLCGRLPLAIRLAAARLKHRRTWTVADLIGRLQDAGARLTALDDGQRSVTAALELSYQQLPACGQRLYRLLGLHPGPDVEPYAAAALTGDSLDEVRQRLDGLVDDHLLAEPSPGRYRFHDLVRAHAASLADRAETAAQQRAAQGRLLDHYRHAAATAAVTAHPYEHHRIPAVPSAGTPTPELSDRNLAGRWLDTELANLLAAAHLAADRGWPQHTFVLSLILEWQLRACAYHHETQTLFQRALNIASHLGNHQAEVNALNGLGRHHRMLDAHRQAIDHFEQALQIAQDNGYRSGQIYALNSLGYTFRAQGRLEHAGQHHERALHLARNNGDPSGELDAHNGLGHVYRILGHHQQAVSHYRRALQIAQSISPHGGELHALIGIGHTYLAQGLHHRAAEHYQPALDLAREHGLISWQFEALQGLGRLHHATGHPHLALTHHLQALQHATDLANPGDQARAHDGLAHAHHAMAQTEQARQHWQRALDILTELGAEHTHEAQTTVPNIRAHLVELDQPRQPPTRPV